MAITATDWTIDRATGDIRYIGDDHSGTAPSYATVIQFHRWLQGLADDAVAVGDDELDITNILPSGRSTDNIIALLGTYNIDATASEHLYDGSIIQDGGDEIYDGIINFGNSDVQIQIIQDGGVIADDWWNYGGAGLNPDANAGVSHRFMLLVSTGGTDTDGRRLIGICRTFNNTYSEFKINGSARGNNVLALNDSADLNNETSAATVSGWTSITNLTEGYANIDVNNDGADEYYYSEWDVDKPTRSINDFFERMKWLTMAGSASTIYGLNGELFRGITHEITVDTVSTTDFSAYEPVTWTGGTGQMFAIDDVNAATKMWIQLLTGVAPTDGQTITGTTSGATADVNVTVTDRSSLIQTPFCGVSTGSAIIGSYGFGITATELTSNDKVFDLANAQVTPPNYVTNTVAGLVSGEDYTYVVPWDGSTYDAEGNPAIEKDQLSLDGALTTDNVTTLDVIEVIPADTPSTGYIRVTDDLGFERRLHYSAWSVSTFTIDTTDGNEDFSGDEAATLNDVYISYIDVLASGVTESFTGVYDADDDLVVIVRDGGATPIKQFISAWSFQDSNKTITAIRTTDA